MTLHAVYHYAEVYPSADKAQSPSAKPDVHKYVLLALLMIWSTYGLL